ncbi:MAG TPA: pantoate--beta-alanine ligase [bacterium]|nr:pantoate--beta-alanine ligase [bacterium]
MDVIRTFADWRARRRALQGTLGLVPTMGYLHEGHLSLVRRARAENDRVVVWIFVNPAQFGPAEDLAKYPRDLERDLSLLRAEGVDLVLAPDAAEVYPPGHQTVVSVEALSRPLEGASRPGHFRGVATVVAKLLCLAQADRAYFGQKDGQQCRVVQRMVADLSIPCQIVVCPTVREPDGLALSSRNVRLTPEHRRAAPVVYRALQKAEALAAAGERDAEALRTAMRAVLAEEPLGIVDYVSVADAATLEECATLSGPTLASLAVRFGDVRLIDNVPLPAPRD